MRAAGCYVVSVDCEDLMQAERDQFRIGDMNARLPAEDGELDAVVSIDGIEHIERPFDFVAECARVIRPGGRLFVSTPNVSSLRSRWRWFWTGFHDKCKAPLDDAQPTPLHHINMIGLPKLVYMLRRNGFLVERISTNRVKGAAWLYLPLVPLVRLISRAAVAREIRRETAPEHRADHQRRSDALLQWMFSRPVLFGEILIVEARRSAQPGG